MAKLGEMTGRIQGGNLRLWQPCHGHQTSWETGLEVYDLAVSSWVFGGYASHELRMTWGTLTLP